MQGPKLGLLPQHACLVRGQLPCGILSPREGVRPGELALSKFSSHGWCWAGETGRQAW